MKTGGVVFPFGSSDESRNRYRCRLRRRVTPANRRIGPSFFFFFDVASPRRRGAGGATRPPGKSGIDRLIRGLIRDPRGRGGLRPRDEEGPISVGWALAIGGGRGGVT